MFEFTRNIKKKINFFISSSFLYKEHNLTVFGRKLTHETMLELIWTILPSIILVCLAIPSLKLLYMLDFMGLEYEPIITVKVIGHQWYWSYEFLVFDYSKLNELVYENVSIDSYLTDVSTLEPGYLRLLEVDHPLILPSNTYIRLLITSVDVLHCWAVPSLGVKCDAVPGRLNQVFIYIKRPGTYYGQCSEICGVNHAFMPIKVICTPEQNA